MTLDSVHKSKKPRLGKETDSPATFLERITLKTESHNGLVRNDHFMSIFNKYQVVFLPKVNVLRSDVDEDKIKVDTLSGVFSSLEKADRDTFTEETWDDRKKIKSSGKDEGETSIADGPKMASGSFLSDSVDNLHQRGYCSFIVQHDEKKLQTLLKSIPVAELPIAAAATAALQNDGSDSIHQMEYGPGLWIFFGRNGDLQNDLEGRGEHTDSIEHDGTFHYQWSGIKDWHLRPTKELLKSMNGDPDLMIQEWIQASEQDVAVGGIKRLEIRCEEGDMLFVNTALWWHRTTIPCQPKHKSCSVTVPSVSYARDIYLDETTKSNRQGSNMKNLDGLYASNDIESGTIIFRESEMPDCELHRTKENPNCEIIELDDGEGAIVSCRDIKCGEFFCLLDSDAEDEEFVTDYEEEEEEEEE